MKESPWVPLVVLSALQDGELHGYGIAQRVRDQSEELVRLSEGMLYPLLHELERDGLVQSRWERPDAGRDRKYYRLTESGRRELTDGRQRWSREVRVLSRLLGVAR